MSDDPNGQMAEEKRMVTILLKEIETYIAQKQPTPLKGLTQNKSLNHLRLRTTSGSRSTTSLHAPSIGFNNS